MKRATLVLLSLAIIIIGCSKDSVKIGNGDPRVEIQKCMQLSEKKKFEEAVECLEVFKSKFPKTAYSTDAELSIADNYFDNREYLLAADTYLLFIRMHPKHPKADYAYYRLGLSYLKETPRSIDRDQQYLQDAIRYLKAAVQAFPNSPYHEAAVESLNDGLNRVAERNFYIGRFYYRSGQYKAAMPRFLDVVNNFRGSKRVPQALYMLTNSAGKLRMMDEAKLFYSKLSIDFPNDKWTEKAEKKVLKYAKKYKYTGGATDNFPVEAK